MMFYLKLNLIVFIDVLLRFRQACTPRKLTLAVRKKQLGDIETFYFTPNKQINYQAGQYGIWMLRRFVKGKPARLFTVASAPGGEYIELTTRISDSDFKQKLAALSVGDSVIMFGPVGRFTLPKQDGAEAVFIAGGIGVTPFNALLHDIAQRKLPVNTTLVHVARDNEHLYQSELADLANRAYFVSRTELDATLETVKNTAATDTVYYISGPPYFVKTIAAKLKKAGIKRIKLDGFLGY